MYLCVLACVCFCACVCVFLCVLVCVCVGVSVCVFSYYLPCVGGHSPGHHSLQVAAQTDALHCDDGLLGQDGSAWRGYNKHNHQKPSVSHTQGKALRGTV